MSRCWALSGTEWVGSAVASAALDLALPGGLEGESMKVKLMLDSDVIGDDILAMICCAGIDSIDLCGVTSYGRRMSPRERAAVAVGVLHATGHEATPVAAGANAPLLRAPRAGCAKVMDLSCSSVAPVPGIQRATASSGPD